MPPQSKTTILYLYTKPSTFVRRDIQVLGEEYKIKEFSFYHFSKWYTPILFCKQIVFLIANAPKAKVAFCMFAGYHSLLPALYFKLMKKPYVIIPGGTESVSIPSIGYGIVNKGLIGKFLEWSYKFTSEFAPVHQSLIYSENTYDPSLGQYQGIKHYFPKLKAHFTVIPNGFDPTFFCPRGDKISNSFITVAFDLHKPHLFQLKGVDLITSIAPFFPDCTFTIVGLSGEKKLPQNVIQVPALPQDELIEAFSKSQFYFQLSLSEGFPNALCEAMLCNCIPIVSNVASMPEIVGNSGFILQNRNLKLLKDLISNDVLRSNRKFLADSARKRIIEHYHLEERKKKFLDLVNHLI